MLPSRKHSKNELEMMQGKDWSQCPPRFQIRHSVHAYTNDKIIKKTERSKRVTVLKIWLYF